MEILKKYLLVFCICFVDFFFVDIIFCLRSCYNRWFFWLSGGKKGEVEFEIWRSQIRIKSVVGMGVGVGEYCLFVRIRFLGSRFYIYGFLEGYFFSFFCSGFLGFIWVFFFSFSFIVIRVDVFFSFTVDCWFCQKKQIYFFLSVILIGCFFFCRFFIVNIQNMEGLGGSG